MYQTDCIQFSKFLPELANKSCEYLLGFEAEMMLVVFLHTNQAGNLKESKIYWRIHVKAAHIRGIQNLECSGVSVLTQVA